MKQHRKAWDTDFKQQLDQELQAVQMSEAAKDAVIQQTKKKPNFWNREITVPVPAAAFAMIVVIGIGLSSVLQQDVNIPRAEHAETELVDIGSGTFYAKDLERILKQ